MILQLFKALFAIGASAVLVLSTILLITLLCGNSNSYDDVDE